MKIADTITRWGVRISSSGFLAGEVWLPAREPWYVCRKVLIAHTKQRELANLADKRPNTFGGLTTCNEAGHEDPKCSKSQIANR